VRHPSDPYRLEEEPNGDASVRHLIELGYVDPEVVAAREAVVRRELEAEFQQAAKCYELGDVEGAARLFEKLSADDLDWIAPRQFLAEIYYRTGRITEARSQLDWLTVHAVEQPRLALISGTIALADRELAEALDALEYAAHVEPTLPSVHTLLGTTRLRLADIGGAEKAFQMAVKQNAADAPALDGLAAVCLRRRDFAAAANYALEALQHDIQLFRAHYHLGVALASMDRPRDATAAFENAVRINARSAAPYCWLQRIAKKLGDAVLAAQYRERGREVIRRRRTLLERGRGDKPAAD
jgi:tetratricopeptide (TPR) repeat protein